MSEPRERRKPLTETQIGLIVIGIIIAMVVATALILIWQLDNWGERGSFGDSFGVLNVIFSGLAFSGIIWAIVLQRKDLAVQKDELTLTRGELEGQKLQLQKQNATLLKQNFENTFFNLIRLHNEIVSDMARESHLSIHGPTFTSGRKMFSHFYNEIQGCYKKVVDNGVVNLSERIDSSFQDWFRSSEAEVIPYFRNLQNTFQFIKDSEVQEKQQYADFLKAQLSRHELGCLFYYGLSTLGGSRFRPLCEEFAIFEGFDNSLLFDPQSDTAQLYETAAFVTRSIVKD